jgi:hypothetical protein
MRPPTALELWENFHRRGARPAGRPGEALDLALRKAGYLTAFTGSSFARQPVDWSSFRLVVLPENALLDQRAVDQLRRYVSGGGTLLAMGHASLFDELGGKRANFALQDVLGVEFAGELPGYKQFAAATGGGIAANIRLNPGALKVKSASGKVLAVWRSAGDAPAVVENQFGKGRAIYVSAAETPLAESALLAELAGRLIGSPAVEIHAARTYSFVINRKGTDLLLYLMNRSTGSRAFSESGMAPDPSLVLGPEEVRLTLNTSALGAIAAAEMLPDSKPVRLSRRAAAAEVQLNASPSVTALRLSKY